MALSRYSDFSKVRKNSKDQFRLETFPAITREEFNNIPHNIVIWKETDRMDALATDLLGSAQYWWIICIMNNLVNPFSYNLLPGTPLKIPHDVNSVISIIQKKLKGK